jgi:hypothetical protein
VEPPYYAEREGCAALGGLTTLYSYGAKRLRKNGTPCRGRGAGVFCAVVGERIFYEPIIAGLKRPVLLFAADVENTGGV